MGDVTKIIDKCKRCHTLLKKDEDIFCNMCLAADAKEVEAEVEGEEKEKVEEKKGPLLSVYVDDARGPILVVDSEQGMTPMSALELMLYLTEDLKMNLTAARVAQNIASMSRDKKTFDRLFRGASKGTKKN